MQARIKSCPNKGYWYWGMVGEIISITGEKQVDDGLHERSFALGKDDNVPLTQISYLIIDRIYLCAKGVEVEDTFRALLYEMQKLDNQGKTTTVISRFQA